MKAAPLQKTAEMLKSLLCITSNEGNTNLIFIPYGINTVSKAGTMRNIILQHNAFFKNMAIVPFVNIKDKDAEKVKTILITHSISQDDNLQDKQ